MYILCSPETLGQSINRTPQHHQLLELLSITEILNHDFSIYIGIYLLANFEDSKQRGC